MDILPLLTCAAILYLGVLLARLPFKRKRSAPAYPWEPSPPWEEDTRSPYNPRDATDLCHTYFILRHLLPPELIPPILDLASYWLKVSSNRSDHMAAVESRPRRYLTTPPISSPVFRPVRKVVFTIYSRDQGWSSFREQWNTYENSWTWFDAQVVGLGPQGVVSPDENRTKRVVTNLHAGQQYHCHSVVWSDDDEDEEIKTLVRTVRNGEAISIVAKAMFRLWINHIGSVQIDVYLAAFR